MANTPDQNVADIIGQSIDGRIAILQAERVNYLPAAAAARVVEIDAELAALATEKTRIDPRRPIASAAISTQIKGGSNVQPE